MEALHLIARTSVQWMAYCLIEGTILALLAWTLLRLIPRQNAGTRFALWFSVLLAIVALPFLASRFSRAAGTGEMAATHHSLITLRNSMTLGIWAIWAVIAMLGLARVVAGLWQVNRIRKGSQEVDAGTLNSEVQVLLNSFPRPVTLRVSDEVQVPAAVGFFHPAVVIPRWLLEEISPAELQQVLLHELTHLRRRDDWTNLTQKMIKALLFFHPSVWWVEQKLSLEREMACDEAVLAVSSSPHRYAQCLTRLAERSLIRKRIALAQAAINRMRQLSLRLTQILDRDRPGNTRIWKPAVPLVCAAAALCAFSAGSAPTLVAFQDDAAKPVLSQTQAPHDVNNNANPGQPQMILASASLNRASNPGTAHPAINKVTAKANHRLLALRGTTVASNEQSAAENNTRSLHMPGKPSTSRDDVLSSFLFNPLPSGLGAQKHAPATTSGDYVMRAEQVVVTMASVPGGSQPQMWQVSMWQVNILVHSVDQTSKPVPRKKI